MEVGQEERKAKRSGEEAVNFERRLVLLVGGPVAVPERDASISPHEDACGLVNTLSSNAVLINVSSFLDQPLVCVGISCSPINKKKEVQIAAFSFTAGLIGPFPSLSFLLPRSPLSSLLSFRN